MSEAETDLDALMDDMQVLYQLRAGQTVSQEDVEALNRLDEHWREDGERVLDAYHRGWREGVTFAGGADLVEMEDRLSSFWVQHATDKYMRQIGEQKAAETLAHLKFAVKLLSAFPALSGTAQVEAMRAFIAKAESPAGHAVCINHPDRPMRENLDGEDLCQECCDAWARAEGQAQAGEAEAQG